MSTPSIKVGQGNWGIKTGNLLGYANTEKKFSPVEFTSTRALNTATRVNASGNIEGVLANVPRIDYFGGQASLLVEPSAQNLVLQSTFSTGWSASFSGSVSGNASGTNSPEGSGNAALLSVVATAFSSIYRTITTVSGSVYTASVFAKKRDKNFLYFVNIAGNAAVAWFNLASGTVGTVGANTTARIENYGNGWYRCSITQTVGGTTSYIQFGLSDADNTNAAASSGSNFVFGAQFELGSVATSYIPTTTGSVTRNADVISVTGVAGLIGQTEGTIYAEVDVRTLGAAKNILQIDDGTATNRIGLFVDISPTRLTFLMSSAGVTNSLSGTVATGVIKIAASYSSGNVQVFTNGSFLVSGTIATYPIVALNAISVGSRISSGVYGIFLNDRIRAASIYQTRLPNTTTDGSPSLQSITTL